MGLRSLVVTCFKNAHRLICELLRHLKNTLVASDTMLEIWFILSRLSCPGCPENLEDNAKNLTLKTGKKCMVFWFG